MATPGPAPSMPAPAAPATGPSVKGPPPSFTLAGGARILPDGTLNAPDVLLGIILVIGIAQAHLIPSDIHRFTDTILGRILLFAGAIAMTAWKGWVLGLLTATFVLRLIMHSNRQDSEISQRYATQISEGFSSRLPDLGAPIMSADSHEIKPVIPNKSDNCKNHKWFVERLFDEEPILIETEKVRTLPVQGR
jgi:hypothetical protein